MEIRPAYENDIPAIVELLKLSLGESLMPKSEAFWRWKHMDNPFGKSPVLLAFEGDQLIGVRAFMRWEWKQGDKIFKAVRAVDTATHPQHQGKGIFKKLTLQLVDQCRKEGVDFIFNTPNKSSKPGYLKMGWSEVGPLPVVLSPRIPFMTRRNDFDSRYQITSNCLDHLSDALTSVLKSMNGGLIRTHYTQDFIRWRYGSNPNIPYFLAHDASHLWFIIFRLKVSRVGMEFRICDLLGGVVDYRSSIIRELRSVIWHSGATWVSCAQSLSILPSIRLSVGPDVTVNPLHENLSLSFENWKPTLGDMEVF